VGGAVGREQSIARAVGYRCLASEVPDAIARLLSVYNRLRNDGENLRQFFSRHSNDEIRGFLAGGITLPVPRDLPTATTPHGIEG
jgi:sulfite reductase (ferredoxin)